MKERKYLIGVVVTFLLFASLCVYPALAAQDATELVPFYTTPAGGGGYILGSGAIALSNKYMTGVKFVHMATTGSLEMIRRLMAAESQKKDAFAVLGQVDAWNAYRGEAEYKGKPFPALRSIMFNQFGDVYLVVPANSPIKSYADVRGKRIGMGGPGSSPANAVFYILAEYGITKSDFKPYYYVYKETLEGMQDGSLDGGVLSGGYPVSSYLELSTKMKLRIVPVDEKIANKIIAERPGHFTSVLKAKSYKEMEHDTPIIAVSTAFWTHAGVSSDLVYRWLKNLFDHKEEYYAVHKDAKVMTKENAIKTVGAPFHPGAEKYLKEIGAIK
jgi:TRAP transporter TAXI family solute receptor